MMKAYTVNKLIGTINIVQLPAKCFSDEEFKFNRVS